MGRRRKKAKFHDLCNETLEVARLYFRAFDSGVPQNGRRDMNMALDSHVKGSNEANSLYIARIEKAFKSLDTDSRRIINNDFFFNNYKFWWLELYSTSTYYRLKRVAMCRFLDSLD